MTIERVEFPVRGVLVKDDSSHFYFIPTNKIEAFEKWVENTEGGTDDDAIDFEKCRLKSHLSTYVFDFVIERE
jgi:hypothetical protein